MIILQRTHNLIKARVIVSYLQAANIDARLLDAEMSTMLPVVAGGVRIAVPENQKMSAEKLLAEVEDSFEEN